MKTRLVVLSLVGLGWATVLLAQDAINEIASAEKEAGWIEQFDGKTLSGWVVHGPHKIADGELILDGATLRLDTPLGPRFKLLVEMKREGPSGASLIMETREFMSTMRSARVLYDTANQWVTTLLTNEPLPGRQRRTRIVQKSSNDVGFGSSDTHAASGALTGLELAPPPGTKLIVRRLRLLNPDAPPPGSRVGVAAPFVVLGLILSSIMIAGWWLHRRRAPAAPATTAAALVGLLWGSPLFAQDDPGTAGPDHVRYADWSETTWKLEGPGTIDKDRIALGGDTETRLKFIPTTGDHLDIHLVCQYQGAVPKLHFGFSAGPPGRGPSVFEYHLTGPAGKPVDFQFSGAGGGFFSNYTLRQATRAVDGTFTSSGVCYSGKEQVRELQIVVPPGSEMIIEKLTVTTKPVVERSSSLPVSLAILGGMLGTIMVLGWWLHRRHSGPAPAA